ncbi:MAG TPA: cobalamin-binding protein [Longimicrobiales bacterium]|nr:cobalamin-binding protein [Longimicrobiales bacterium]
MRTLRPTSLLLALHLLACGDARDAAPHAGDDVAAAGVAATDDAGRVIRLDGPAVRVVSLVPSVTDVILALGLESRLIARTEYDVDPRLASLPSVGPGLTPNIEWLAARAPDLVIAWRDVEGRALVNRLGELGIPVYASRLEDVPTALTTITRVGVLLGQPARADSLRASMGARLDSVRLAARDRTAPSVLYLIGGDPPYTPGTGTFVDDLIEIAGGRNLFADLGDGWHSVSVEEVVRRDPDLIVIPVHGSEAGVARALARRPGWRDLRAVRDDRVHEVDGELFGRPGPRLDRAAAALSDLLGRTGTRAGARARARGETP